MWMGELAASGVRRGGVRWGRVRCVRVGEELLQTASAQARVWRSGSRVGGGAGLENRLLMYSKPYTLSCSPSHALKS